MNKASPKMHSKIQPAFTKEFKAKAVLTYRASGRALDQVARELEVPAHALRWWYECAAIGRAIRFWGLASLPFLLLLYFFESRQLLPPELMGSSVIFLVGLPLVGFVVLQTHVLVQLTPALSHGSKPDRCLITMALILLIINVALAAVGQAQLLLGATLSSLFYYAYAWAIVGVETLWVKARAAPQRR